MVRSLVWTRTAYGRRGRDRTCNPGIRNPMLYPIELRALRANLTQANLLIGQLVRELDTRWVRPRRKKRTALLVSPVARSLSKIRRLESGSRHTRRR